MKDFLVSHFRIPNDEITGITIVNAHRLPSRKMEPEVQQKGEPKPDPVIVRFGSMQIVNHILKHVKTADLSEIENQLCAIGTYLHQ